MLLAVTFAIATGIAIAGWRGVLRPPVVVGVIVGGAFANFADRLVGGSVVDMIYLTWWPTFNLADVAITTGVFAMVIHNFIADRRETRAKSATATGEAT